MSDETPIALATLEKLIRDEQYEVEPIYRATCALTIGRGAPRDGEGYGLTPNSAKAAARDNALATSWPLEPCLDKRPESTGETPAVDPIAEIGHAMYEAIKAAAIKHELHFGAARLDLAATVSVSFLREGKGSARVRVEDAPIDTLADCEGIAETLARRGIIKLERDRIEDADESAQEV